MLWNPVLHITILNVKLPIMTNCKGKDIVVWTLFSGEVGLHICVWFQLGWTWHKHHCQITSDSLDNFYCVPFHGVFIGCISDYCSLLLPVWTFVQPPCAEGVVSAPCQSIWSQKPPLRSPIKCNFSQSKLPGLCRDSSHPHQDDTVSTLGLSQHVDAWQLPKENKRKR